MKRILVTADGKDITAQARTYAQYRVYSTLARHVPDFRQACVVLRAEDDGNYEVVACDMTISLDASGTLRVRATGPHVYAAINSAIERLSDVFGVELADERRFG